MADAEKTWIGDGLGKSPDSFFQAFDISDKRSGYLRYVRLIQTADLSDAVKSTLLKEFEIWKRDMAPEFWLLRRARIAAIDTATVLVEGSVPYAESAILQNASVRKPEYLLQNEPVHTKPPLMKREREEEMVEQGKEDGFASSPTYKKSAISPFEKDILDSSSLEDEKDEDAVTLVQEWSHHPLNMVFDCQRFTFTCVLDEQDVSRQYWSWK